VSIESFLEWSQRQNRKTIETLKRTASSPNMFRPWPRGSATWTWLAVQRCGIQWPHTAHRWGIPVEVFGNTCVAVVCSRTEGRLKYVLFKPFGEEAKVFFPYVSSHGLVRTSRVTLWTAIELFQIQTVFASKLLRFYCRGKDRRQKRKRSRTAFKGNIWEAEEIL